MAEKATPQKRKPNQMNTETIASDQVKVTVNQPEPIWKVKPIK